MHLRKELLNWTLFRFGLIGLSNTLIGYAVILTGLYLGFNDFAANLNGYVVGLIFSFFLNRSWVFNSQSKTNITQVSQYIITFLISYILNLFVLIAGNKLGYVNSPILQLVAMAVYTTSFYLLSRFVVFRPASEIDLARSDTNGVTKILPLLSRHYWLWANILFALGLLTYLLTIPLTHDVSWQFWLARQMAGGTPLYGHLMEINPPLWFWMAYAVEAAGKLLSIAPLKVYVFLIVIWAMLSTMVFVSLAQITKPSDRIIASFFTLSLLLLAPLYDFGQREQLTSIGILPYIALTVSRYHARAVSSGAAIAAGLFAALAIAMKHYFVAVPILLEIWLLLELRKQWRPIRWETAILAAGAISYFLAIIFFAPEYLTNIVPLIRNAYQGYENSWSDQILRVEVILWAAGLAWFGYDRLMRPKRPKNIANSLPDGLMVAAIGFILAYFAQQKGWQYHAIPASICIALAMFIYIFQHPDRAGQKPAQKFAAQPLATVLAFAYIIFGLGNGTYDNQRPGLGQYYDRWSSGDAVMVVTPDPRLTFPHVEDRHVRWTSRHFAQWMLSAIAKAENSGTSSTKLDELARQTLVQLAEDISCHSPKYIYVQMTNRRYGISPEQFRMDDFLQRDQRVNQILHDNYRLADQDSNFDIFELRSKVKPIAGVKCYPIW